MDSGVRSFRQLAIHIHKQEAEGDESLYSAKFQHLIYSGTHWMVVFTVTVFLSTSAAHKFVSSSYCVDCINHVV